MEFELLSKYKIAHPPYDIVKSAKEASSCAKKIGFPVAMKVISSAALHKTEKGGVILNVKNEKEVVEAYGNIVKRYAGMKVDGVLVQKMAGERALEMIIGGKRDPQFGQMIMLGMGGIFVEVMRDFSFRICPITKEDAEEMIDELRGKPLLFGARGRKPVNKNALIDTLLKVSNLLQKENPKEFDLNPLMVDEKGCVVVDVRIIR